MVSIVCWLVVMIIAAVVEVIQLSYRSIWFGLGALAAALTALFGAPLWVQILLFALVSWLGMMLLGPVVRRKAEQKKQQLDEKFREEELKAESSDETQ